MMTAIRLVDARRGWLATLTFALLAFPVVCYGAGSESLVEEGIRAYEAKDHRRARELFDQACKAGYIVGCFNLAVMWDKGEAGPQDKAFARKLYELTCKSGFAEACSTLAQWEERARLEAEQTRLAAERAKLEKEKEELDRQVGEAEREVKAAKNNVDGDVAYKSGDLEGARELYEQACEGGSALGCTNLGTMLADGESGPRDSARARTLYEQACAADDDLGCVRLGEMLARGEGGPQDMARARLLRDRACEGPTEKHCGELNLVVGEGGSQDVAQASNPSDSGQSGAGNTLAPSLAKEAAQAIVANMDGNLYVKREVSQGEPVETLVVQFPNLEYRISIKRLIEQEGTPLCALTEWMPGRMLEYVDDGCDGIPEAVMRPGAATMSVDLTERERQAFRDLLLRVRELAQITHADQPERIQGKAGLKEQNFRLLRALFDAAKITSASKRSETGLVFRVSGPNPTVDLGFSAQIDGEGITDCMVAAGGGQMVFMDEHCDGTFPVFRAEEKWYSSRDREVEVVNSVLRHLLAFAQFTQRHFPLGRGELAPPASDQTLSEQPRAPAEPVATTAVSLEGLYDAQGTNTDGSRYSGTCRVTKIGDADYRFDWSVGGSYTGTGRLEGNAIAVDWGSDAPVIYEVRADGVLVGTWANGRATETLYPRN